MYGDPRRWRLYVVRFVVGRFMLSSVAGHDRLQIGGDMSIVSYAAFSFARVSPVFMSWMQRV